MFWVRKLCVRVATLSKGRVARVERVNMKDCLSIILKKKKIKILEGVNTYRRPAVHFPSGHNSRSFKRRRCHGDDSCSLESESLANDTWVMVIMIIATIT